VITIFNNLYRLAESRYDQGSKCLFGDLHLYRAYVMYRSPFYSIE